MQCGFEKKKEAPLIHNLILHIKNANTMNEIFATLFQGNNSNSDTYILLVAKLLSWNYSLYMYKEVYLCTLVWKIIL